MDKILRNMSDKALLDLKQTGGDLSKASDETLQELKLARDAHAPLPTSAEIQKGMTPKWESAAQGAASSMALGLDDEIGGVASWVTGKGYKQGRDAIREQKQIRKESNPMSYLAGSVAGGVISPALITANVGAGLGKVALANAGASAGSGALQRLGDAEGGLGDTFDPGAVGTDVVLGGALGAGGYALAKAANPAKALKEVGSAVSDYGQAIKKGVSSADNSVAIAGTTLDNILQVKRSRAEATALAGKVRSMLGPGGAKDLTDKEVLTLALMEGDPQVTKWATSRAGVTLGVDAEGYNKLATTSPTDTLAARTFDKKAAAEETLPFATNAQKSVQEGASARYGELQNEARDKFQTNVAKPEEVIDELKRLEAMAIEQPELIGSPSKIVAARRILEEGSETLPGLTRGPWFNVSESEVFDRMQRVRKLMDDNINFSKTNNLSTGENNFRSARGTIDDKLKISPDKAEADDIWSTFRKLGEGFDDGLEFKGTVDKYKLARLFSDTDNANRFRDKLPELEELAARLGPKASEDLKAFISKLKEGSDKAGLQRELNAFRQRSAGPSGPAIEKLNSILGNNTLLDDALKNPDTFLRRREQIAKVAEEYFGKPFKDLTADEKLKLLKYVGKIKADGGTMGDDIATGRGIFKK